ncbi:hypothetical protein TNCV_4849441 [Trichonephila clavipes]|nr:hypothetical protein TNCV_4849441 [Trichonephila clavipes]
MSGSLEAFSNSTKKIGSLSLDLAFVSWATLRTVKPRSVRSTRIASMSVEMGRPLDDDLCGRTSMGSMAWYSSFFSVRNAVISMLVCCGGEDLQVDEGDLGGFGVATGTAALTETGIALLPAKALNLLWTLKGASTPIE